MVTPEPEDAETHYQAQVAAAAAVQYGQHKYNNPKRKDVQIKGSRVVRLAKTLLTVARSGKHNAATSIQKVTKKYRITAFGKGFFKANAGAAVHLEEIVKTSTHLAKLRA